MSHTPSPAQAAREDAPQALRVMLILSALMSFASISTDLYLPAMPVMTRDLHGAPGQLALTLSTFLIGFSAGQLFWGPLGDRMGRLRPILIGLGLFVVGSLGCALAGSVEQLMAWRVLQAMGASAGPVLARAMVRDLYSREQSARMLSTLIMLMAVAPMLGPLLGSQILALASWRWIFGLLVAVGLATMLVLRLLPESLPADKRIDTPMRHVFADYLMLVRSPRLLGYALAGGSFYAGAYAFVAGSPFAYIEHYGVSPQTYGLLFGLNIVGIILANYANVRWIPRIGSARLFRLGALIAAASGVLVAIEAHTGWGGLAGLAVPALIYMSMNGLIVANSVANVLAEYPRHAGAASALLGAVHYGSGILSAALVSACADGTAWPMGAIIGVSGVLSLGFTWIMRYR